MDTSVFASLYTEAIVESERAARHAEIVRAQDAAILAQKIKDAQDQLVNDILDSAPAKIIEAASTGARAVDLLTFNGSDMVADLSLVFLVRGPRRGAISDAHADPLAPRLSALMAPFVVRHEWDAATNGNRVVASWR